MAKIYRGGVHKKVSFVQLLIKYLHIQKKLYTFATLSFNIISNKGIYFVKIRETSASRLTCFYKKFFCNVRNCLNFISELFETPKTDPNKTNYIKR